MNIIDPRTYNKNFPSGVNISNIYKVRAYDDGSRSPDYNLNSPFALYRDRTFIIHLRYKAIP